MNDFNELHALYHHGILGQKWGVRRYQNEDGTLTEEGKKRYLSDPKFKEKIDKISVNSSMNNMDPMHPVVNRMDSVGLKNGKKITIGYTRYKNGSAFYDVYSPNGNIYFYRELPSEDQLIKISEMR